MNVAMLVGNLVRDPEMRYLKDGKAVTSFRLAVNEGFGERKSVMYIDCQAWGELGESLAETGRKGNRVMVEGRISINKWEDREGNKRETYRITANNAAVVPSSTKRPDRQADALDVTDIPF